MFIIHKTQISRYTDIPLIKQKNDLRIDAGVSLVPAINTSVAYGLSDKFALHGFGSIGINEAKYFQIAPGFYKNYPNRTVFEIYTGFGAGYGDTKRNLYGNYQEDDGTLILHVTDSRTVRKRSP